MRCPPRSAGRALAATLSLVAAACSSPASSPSPSGPDAAPPPAAAYTSEIDIVPYAGALARDERVLSFAAAARRTAPAVCDSLRDAAGLQYLRDRGPRVALVDGGFTHPVGPMERLDDGKTLIPSSGRVELRVVDGLRRPVIRIRATAVASGEFVAEDDLPPLLAEAAVLAAAGERAPPGWVPEGLALHLGGALERRVLEAALARPEVPLGTLDDPALAPGFRAAALERIAVGVRPLPRYLARRLAGIDEETALREIGIEGEEFLDAAATTERSRAFRDLSEDGPVVAVRDARAALLRGDLDAAESILAREESFGRVAAAKDLVAAEGSFIRGDLLAAEWSVEQSLATGGPGVRLRDACWLLAQTARADDVRRRRLVAFVRSFPDDPRCEEAARMLGLDAAALRGSVGAERAARAAAAVALGKVPEGARAAAHEVLRAMLSDGESYVRCAVATSFEALGTKDAASELDALGGDPEPAVRVAALWALAQIDRPRAESRALLLLEDPSPEVRNFAERVLSGSAPPPGDE